LGDPGGIAHALSTLGDIALFEGELAEASRIYAEILELIDADPGESLDEAICLHCLAECRRRQGEYEEATANLVDAIKLATELNLIFGVPDMLDTAAGLTGLSDARRGAVLVGAAETLRKESGFDYFDRAESERIAVSLRDSLGESEFNRALDEGRQLPVEAAMQAALESLD
jgi:tetratricopeptide (TPR) repeat protein